jgi:hypothetical protein
VCEGRRPSRWPRGNPWRGAARRRRRKDADTAPHTKHGPPGDLLGFLGHAARAAARLFRQLERQGRLRAKRIGGGFRGGPRSGDSFRGGGSFHGGGSFRGGGPAAATSATSAAAPVRAAKISARLIERA